VEPIGFTPVAESQMRPLCRLQRPMQYSQAWSQTWASARVPASVSDGVRTKKLAAHPSCADTRLSTPLHCLALVSRSCGLTDHFRRRRAKQ
jgi:hypothetical protein